MRMKIAYSLVGVLIVLYFALMIYSQVKYSNSDEESKIKYQKSLNLWFGSSGPTVMLILLIVGILTLAYVPMKVRQTLDDVKELKDLAKRAVTKIEVAADTVGSVTRDVQKSTQVTDAMKSGFELLTNSLAKRALGSS